METNPQDLVIKFIDLSAHPLSAEADKCVTAILSSYYGASMARTLKFLLDHVDEATRKRFAYTYLDPSALACRATAKIVVRPANAGERTSRNKGCILFFIRTSDGQERPIHFTNQVSAVYFLMLLIDRYQKGDNALVPPKLAENSGVFASLYHAVYDNVTHDEVLRKFKSLLYRNVDGRLRTGRLNAVIYDIRRTMAAIFENMDESFFPYAMTLRSHLSLPPCKILFEGSARRLLYFWFK